MKHQSWVVAIDISPNSTKLVTGSEDNTAIVWDIKTGRRVSTLKHSNWVWAVRFSPDSTRIATYAKGSPITIFGIDGTPLLRIQQYINTDFKRPKTVLDWSSNWRLFSACKGVITCFDSSTGSILAKWLAHRDESDTFVVASRRSRLLVSWQVHTIAFWDTSTFVQIGPVLKPDLPIQSISIDPHGVHLAINERDNTITIRDLRKILPEWFLSMSHPPQENPGGTSPTAQSIVEHEFRARVEQSTVKDVELFSAFSTPQSPQDNSTGCMKQWANAKLSQGSWKDALSSATELNGVPTIVVYESICDALEEAGRLTEATGCFLKMEIELEGDTIQSEHTTWSLDFKRRLEKLANAVTVAHVQDEADSLHPTVLSSDQESSVNLHIKRSKERASEGKWEDAISDANMAISLVPSAPWGYDARRAALLGAGRYDDAVLAYKTMFWVLSRSPDPEIHSLRSNYVSPSKIAERTLDAVQRTVRGLPGALIHTTTGRIWQKNQQATAFLSSPAYKKLVASMTTEIDNQKIEEEVVQYYKYAMLSHVWEGDEPLLQMVENISVYELPETLTNVKLQEFCKLMRTAGFTWAWSDTCCINKENQVVLQESIVAMFKWYRGSALTIVFLRDIPPFGSLLDSKWIHRGWTYQEYVASTDVRFYAENWTPYRNLPTTTNHKEHPDIISEMMKVTGALTSFVRALEQGPEHIREKLCLAATRQTTLAEDAAYSLLGIFSASIPIIYGEGESAAIGRLLGHLLTASGDASILAWTGESGDLNSCFPAQITVFSELATSHLPAPLSDVEMDSIVEELQNSLLDRDSVAKLYDRLQGLSLPSFASDRIKLPCIVFELPPLTGYETETGFVYDVETVPFGKIEIETAEFLDLDSLYLIHPWLGALLGHQLGKSKRPKKRAPMSPTLQDEEGGTNDKASSRRRPLQLPATRAPQVDKHVRALHLIARLRQPFSALLVADMGQHYKRIAADALITVRVKEDMPLTDLIDNARVIDIR